MSGGNGAHAIDADGIKVMAGGIDEPPDAVDLLDAEEAGGFGAGGGKAAVLVAIRKSAGVGEGDGLGGPCCFEIGHRVGLAGPLCMGVLAELVD